jgi:protein disulfide-isomerase
METTKLVVWSDYLCPWCYNGSVRLRRVEELFEGQVELEWRSFLLRPEPAGQRDLEKFRAYTRSWLRPAASKPSGEFRVWQGDAGPPTHSVPPHLVAKAAASLGDEEFRAIHDQLLRAYFSENRDITDDDTLRAVWGEAGLPESEFERRGDPAHLQAVLSEHHDAYRHGVTGVPSVMIDGQNVPITGAHPVELYVDWIRKIQARA